MLGQIEILHDICLNADNHVDLPSAIEVYNTLYVFHVIYPKQFLAQCMEHTQQPVRTAAFDSLLQIYSHCGNAVRQKLSMLEEKKSSIVWRKLFESFDRIDGKPSAADIAVRDPSPYHK